MVLLSPIKNQKFNHMNHNGNSNSAHTQENLSSVLKEYFDGLMKKHSVVLFMKGTPDAPLCGFSGFVVKILKTLEVSFHSVNVLEDMSVREGIKIYGQWPTIPQLYLKGELVGGCDIVQELFKSGALKSMFSEPMLPEIEN